MIYVFRKTSYAIQKVSYAIRKLYYALSPTANHLFVIYTKYGKKTTISPLPSLLNTAYHIIGVGELVNGQFR